MKRFTTLLLAAALACHSLHADPVVGVLDEAKVLISEKKYLTAYQLIEKADPDDRDLETLMMKYEILSKYFISRISAEFFALRDLGEDERIEDVRGEAGSFDMFHFNPQEKFAAFLEKAPDEPRIHRALGNFHYDPFVAQPDAVAKDGTSQADLARQHFEKAVKGGLDDDATRFALGHIEMAAGNLVQCIIHFEKCIAINADYAAAHFNLANARLETGATRDALVSAHRAVELYTDPGFKSDAASLAGFIHEQLEEDGEALRHYELADAIQPNAYPNIHYLLMAQLRMEQPQARKTALRLMALDPENPTVFTSLEDAHHRTGRAAALIELYQAELESPSTEYSPMAIGNMHFYLARLHMENSPELARKHFGSARSVFAGELPEDHPVFKILDDVMNQNGDE